MDPIYHMTYLQAVVIGLIQGITELFPISSLGHTVLIPSWLGGSWATLVRQESRPESPYLAFVVGLHLATAIVLIGVYARTWVRVIGGFFTSIARREVRSADQKLAWLIVVATIPVGLAGLVLEHPFRVLFAKPLAAAIFLMINGGSCSPGKSCAAGPSGARRPCLRPRAPSPRPRRPRPRWPSGRRSRHRSRPGRVQTAAQPGDRDVMLDEAAEQRLAGVGIWTPCGSGRRRSWPCSPGSAAKASRWSAAWPGGWTTRTRCGSRSCCPPRSSWLRAR